MQSSSRRVVRERGAGEAAGGGAGGSAVGAAVGVPGTTPLGRLVSPTASGAARPPGDSFSSRPS